MVRKDDSVDPVAQAQQVNEATAVYLSSLRQSVQSSDLVRVNLLVPAHVRKEWKAVALATDRTLTDLIIEAMQHMIDRGLSPKELVR
jgi:hypothetical protein